MIKVDSEKHVFQDDCTEKYALILPEGRTRPLCLIRNETVTIMKGGNTKHHYNIKKACCEQNYHKNTGLRTMKT